MVRDAKSKSKIFNYYSFFSLVLIRNPLIRDPSFRGTRKYLLIPCALFVIRAAETKEEREVRLHKRRETDIARRYRERQREIS